MRLIDADALMNQWCDEMCKPKPSCEEDCAVYDYVRLAPSIDIVRCKECKFNGVWCDIQEIQWSGYDKPVEWCSYGEREVE